MPERYVHLDGNLYYDTKDKVIVKNMGNRYVYVRHDRRTKKKDVPENELKRESSQCCARKVAAKVVSRLSGN